MNSELPLGLLEDHEVTIRTMIGEHYQVLVQELPVRTKDLEQALHTHDPSLFPEGCMVFTLMEEDRLYGVMIDPSLSTNKMISRLCVRQLYTDKLSQPIHYSPSLPPFRDTYNHISGSESRWVELETMANQQYTDTPIGCFALYLRYDDVLWHQLCCIIYHYALRKTDQGTWDRYLFIEIHDIQFDESTRMDHVMSTLRVPLIAHRGDDGGGEYEYNDHNK